MGWKQKQNEALKDVKVLVVGSGGIGCELLKNLALSGFKNLVTIDLDTIDVSNLNRQFLFRREHVGQPKAKIATEAVKNFAPDVDITYHHDSIFSQKFNLEFFKSFTIVLNALDNRAARNHVNRMCLSTRTPLVESGSAAYQGQVTVIMRDKTECYECVEKPATQKTFPGCTIRNTPSEHIHCTVWAKHCFNQLFGEIDIDDDVSPEFNDPENKDENEGAEQPPKAEVREEKKLSTRAWAEQVHYDPQQIFDKLFFADIEGLCSMENLWKERRRPTPQQYSEASQPDAGPAADIVNKVSEVWSLQQCVKVFAESVEALKKRKEALPETEVLVWDKDDDDGMRFVATAANIRAFIFGIKLKSLFDIKAMAGNIIPAIATTNAIVAGLIVQEALKIVTGREDQIKNIFTRLVPNMRSKILQDEIPQKPNPKCFVCALKRECCVKLNPFGMTVKGFRDKVLKGHLNMQAPDVVDVLTHSIIISSEEGELDGLFEKKLSEMNIGGGTFLDCDDYTQDLEIKVIIEESLKLKGEEFEVSRDSKTEEDQPLEKEGEEFYVEDLSRKRKLLHAQQEEPETKKVKAN